MDMDFNCDACKGQIEILSGEFRCTRCGLSAETEWGS